MGFDSVLKCKNSTSTVWLFSFFLFFLFRGFSTIHSRWASLFSKTIPGSTVQTVGACPAGSEWGRTVKSATALGWENSFVLPQLLSDAALGFMKDGLVRPNRAVTVSLLLLLFRGEKVACFYCTGLPPALPLCQRVARGLSQAPRKEERTKGQLLVGVPWGNTRSLVQLLPRSCFFHELPRLVCSFFICFFFCFFFSLFSLYVAIL